MTEKNDFEKMSEAFKNTMKKSNISEGKRKALNKLMTKCFMQHCIKHRFFINPYFALVEWADRVIKAGKCPCRADRPVCPCPESVDETKTDGKCACYFFLTEDQFFKFLEKAIQ